MKDVYLEVTFHHGKPIAGYLCLPRKPGDKSCRSVRAEPGLVIDFNENDEPIGIEITAPSKLTLTAFNNVLRSLGLRPVTRADLAPLFAAQALPRDACHEGSRGRFTGWSAQRPRRGSA